MKTKVPNNSPVEGQALDALDQDGRPLAQGHLIEGFKRLSDRAARVLYALALTELRGNKMGLSKRHIRKVLQHEETDELAGAFKWVFNPDILITNKIMTQAVARNAIQDLREYPFVVLKNGNYYDDPSYTKRFKGGVDADIFALNASTILLLPCQAEIVRLVGTGPLPKPVPYSKLSEYVTEEHASHVVPEAMLKIGAKPPDSHTLRGDIEFLARMKYLKLLSPATNREIPWTNSFKASDDATIDLDQRGFWEQPYVQKLARHFR